ncbi:MAG: TIGR03790 family protein [Sandaracinus sp.]|nr:TIGR03790 family protein [Sandaracinus sp.]|tara:strand:+ start:515 stop:1885 length:1371 start_codon:yes stop_codon:yes gene_type:complete
MRTLRLFLACVFLLACGDDDGASEPDAFVAPDAASMDGGTPDDAGEGEEDAGEPDLGPPEPTVILPRTGIEARELGVLINDDDPLSVALGAYYVTARAIPEENVVHLNLPTGAVLSQGDFETAKAAVDAALPAHVEAQLITWTQPYRAACMSITSAFALGFDEMYCNTSGMTCGGTAPIDYYDSDSVHPVADHGLRPTMMLAASSEAGGEALIDRGVAADDTLPAGDGYLVRTTDTARSVRYPTFPGIVERWDHEGGLRFTYVDNADGSGSNVIADTDDVLFYFTGQARIGDIDTNGYRPGAIADHLTSFGGRVPTSGQMSVTEWLDAGVTGSYGTVIEPCNYQTKFPAAAVVIEHYWRGETLVEAYWKSVQWPGEGLFVGEPLAQPFGRQDVTIDADTITIETNAVVPGDTWALETADAEDGPWTELMEVTAEEWIRQTITFDRPDALFIRLVRR